MNKSREKKTLLIVLLLIFMIATVAIIEIWYFLQPPREKMRAALELNPAAFTQATEAAVGRRIEEKDTSLGTIKSLFWNTGLTAIDGRGENGNVCFTFDWTYRYGEVSINLWYIPSNECAVPADMMLVTDNGSIQRWEGGGINNSGYIEVERFQDKWFYVEQYYPT